ncbi:MAG: alkaline phosphatase family protein [Actinomycetales bacterium]|nr:alkaline phosphatase family protein [Actinomycetales bacterium]
MAAEPTEPTELTEPTEPTIADVATSAAASIGLAGFVDRIGLGQAQHAVICLIDGLGWQQLQDAAIDAPVLTSGQGSAISTVFPSTTPTALASLGTGLLPGSHGLVGAMFWLPEESQVLAPLHWGSSPHPLAVQPEATVFERAERLGAKVTTIAPEAYRASGLTRAALRGGQYRAAEAVADRVEAILAATTGYGPTLTYVYWPHLDRIGHEFGAGTREWRQALGQADALAGRLAAALPRDSVMVVTSDHGMVNCPQRLHLDRDPGLMAGVRCIAGEPRARHVYAVDGQASQVERRWRDLLASTATILSRAQVVESGLIVADDWIVERIGDVVALPMEGIALTCSVDSQSSALVGQHGGPSPAETRIPCILMRG